jgi:hypothetical protein
MGGKVRRCLFFSLVLVPVGGVAYFVWAYLYVLTVLQPEAYAVWQTADLVVAYLDQHDGAWPQGWSDLRPLTSGSGNSPYAADRGGAAEVGFRPPLDIDRLQQLVDVDWSADVAALARAPSREPEPPFRVIWLRSGRRTAFEGCEPNRLLKAYLDGRYRVQRP